MIRCAKSACSRVMSRPAINSSAAYPATRSDHSRSGVSLRGGLTIFATFQTETPPTCRRSSSRDPRLSSSSGMPQRPRRSRDASATAAGRFSTMSPAAHRMRRSSRRAARRCRGRECRNRRPPARSIMKSTVCSGVQAPAGFSVRPRAVSRVKTKPGISRCALTWQPARVAQLVLQRLGERLHAGLGDVVGGIARRRGDALLGAGVDDQPRPAALDHGGREHLAAMDDAPQIDAEQPLPVLRGAEHRRCPAGCRHCSSGCRCRRTASRTALSSRSTHRRG